MVSNPRMYGQPHLRPHGVSRTKESSYCPVAMRDPYDVRLVDSKPQTSLFISVGRIVYGGML